MEKEHSLLMAYLKRLQERFLEALDSFYVWETLRELQAPNIVGEEIAKTNHRTITEDFPYFFTTAQEALRTRYLLELAKLFDAGPQSLHVRSLSDFVKGNARKLLVENEQSQQAFENELAGYYTGLNASDLGEIELALQSQEIIEITNKLKAYRDQYLAHDDKSKGEIHISVEEVNKLFDILEKILDLFSSRFDNSSMLYRAQKLSCKSDTQTVVEYIQKYEPYRHKEIENERIEANEKHKNS